MARKKNSKNRLLIIILVLILGFLFFSERSHAAELPDEYWAYPLIWEHDYYVDTSTGEPVYRETSAYTSMYIDLVENAEHFSVMKKADYTCTGYITYYDENRLYLTYQDLFVAGPLPEQDDDWIYEYYPETKTVLTPPQNAAYARVSITCISNIDSWMEQYCLNLFSLNYVRLAGEEETYEQKATGFFGKVLEFFENLVNGIRSMVDFVVNFFDKLLDFITSIVVPDAEEMTGFLEDVNDWFSARLGFLWYPFSLAIDMVTALSGGTADTGFTVPALTLNLLGEQFTIWNEMNVDLDQFGIFKYVRMFSSFLLVGGVVMLASKKWDEVIGGRSK